MTFLFLFAPLIANGGIFLILFNTCSRHCPQELCSHQRVAVLFMPMKEPRGFFFSRCHTSFTAHARISPHPSSHLNFRYYTFEFFQFREFLQISLSGFPPFFQMAPDNFTFFDFSAPNLPLFPLFFKRRVLHPRQFRGLTTPECRPDGFFFRRQDPCRKSTRCTLFLPVHNLGSIFTSCPPFSKLCVKLGFFSSFCCHVFISPPIHLFS